MEGIEESRRVKPGAVRTVLGLVLIAALCVLVIVTGKERSTIENLEIKQ